MSCADLEGGEGLEGKWSMGVMKIMREALVIFKVVNVHNLYIYTNVKNDFNKRAFAPITFIHVACC